MSNNPVQSAVGRLAAVQRHDRGQDPEKIADARNALMAARLERAIREAINPEDKDYKPLRREDRERLAGLLMVGL